MKKRAAAALFMAMLFMCPSCPAERATIPDTMALYEFDRIKPVPDLYTKHSEETMSTYVESDLPMDWVNVNMDLHYTAVPLDEGNRTFTYSTEGLKRQVGIWWSGTWRSNAYLEWVDMEACPTEEDAVRYALSRYSQYASKGYLADPSMFWNVEVRGISPDGSETLLDTLWWLSQNDYEDAEDMRKTLGEEWAEACPDYSAFRFDITDDFQGGWDLYAVNATEVYSFSGDDAYMVGIGNQISVHGRDGEAHTVYAHTDSDLFDTDMECSGTTLTWKRNGNNGRWYVATVESTYENSFTAKISAHYLHDKGTHLVNYDITFINEGITYVVHYAPSGCQLRASASAPFGNFITAGSCSEWDWVNADTCVFETEGRLLPLDELFIVRYR